MELTITKQESAPLCGRQEILAKVSFAGEAAPTGAAIKAELAKKAKAKEDLVVLKGLDAKFGRGSGMLSAYVYASAEDKKRFEPLTKHLKEQIKKAEEERKKAEAEAKQKAEEEAKAKAEAEAKAAEEKAAPAEESSKPAEEKAAPAENKEEKSE